MVSSLGNHSNHFWSFLKSPLFQKFIIFFRLYIVLTVGNYILLGFGVVSQRKLPLRISFTSETLKSLPSNSPREPPLITAWCLRSGDFIIFYNLWQNCGNFETIWWQYKSVKWVDGKRIMCLSGSTLTFHRQIQDSY